jgi:hypothetical protein
MTPAEEVRLQTGRRLDVEIGKLETAPVNMRFGAMFRAGAPSAFSVSKPGEETGSFAGCNPGSEPDTEARSAVKRPRNGKRKDEDSTNSKLDNVSSWGELQNVCGSIRTLVTTREEYFCLIRLFAFVVWGPEASVVPIVSV